MEGKAGRRVEISSLVSISWDLASMARLRYTKDLAAGCVVKNSTTAAPERLAHLERFRCVRRAVLGIEKSAASVILVCATSRCVNFVNFGSKVSNTELGRIVHS